MAATLNATPRATRGKNAARVLRSEGRVPAVIYGHGDETRALSVDSLDLERLLSSISVENTLVEVQLEGGDSTRALIREVQWHPFKPIVLHVDFYQIHAGEAIRLNVPVRLDGAPIGVREMGGVLQQVLHELEIECLPRHIPEVVHIDVTDLGMNDSVHVRDVAIRNVTILNDSELSICSVTEPTVAVLPEPPETEDGVGGEVQSELLKRSGEGVDDVPTTDQGG
ncbi:50S ribosomal protein L25 [soil metagenome]|nr:50S ribosomal protein L25 [Gemmatimonadota bacterium]